MKPWLAASAILFGASSAHATTYYATDFEATAFMPGQIGGQGGWQTFSASSQPALAQVETGVAQSGTQAISVDGAAKGQTGPYYAMTLVSPGKVNLSANIMLSSSAGGAAWQFAAIGPGLIGFAGGIDITKTGAIRAISGSFPTIGAFSYNQWHRVDVVLDYATQTFGVKLDGLNLASGLAFCGSNSGCSGATVGNFGVGIFDSFGGAPGPALGYLDDFSIATPPAGVPEPADWALMLVGLGGLGAVARTARPRVQTT